MKDTLPRIEIDGLMFSSLEEFYDHFSERALDGSFWGRNLDAFSDVLRGGFGTPDGGFKLVWLNHAISKTRLGYDETVRQLEIRLTRCHPANEWYVQADLERARRAQGPTVFDWLIEIISVHCAGGQEFEDCIELELA